MTKQDEILAEVEKARNLIRLAKRLISSRYCEHRYDPDQPRVPAGNPAGGRWTSGANDGALSLRWMIAARPLSCLLR